MSCEDFETIVSELAESRPMDANARVTGLAHVATCAVCAARLSEARSLNTGLQVAAAAETEETPERVRESLLAAFAAHHRAANAPVAPVSAGKGASWRTVSWWGAAALAAAAAVVLALLLPALMRVVLPGTPTQTAGVKPTGLPPTPTLSADGPPKTKIEESSSVGVDQKAADAQSNFTAPHRKRSRVVQKTPPTDSSSATNELAANDNAKPSNQYFPLTYLASATAMESGTVVRIQVSRAKLISLGLPMNDERTNELVKADLVLGDDGVARAIRLVD